ncbi:MAG: TolC family protein [Candidatus Omnitrophica bacterium]|nr:TolC family protein [Candidatus Omnitrophota bacterium]
MDRSRSIVIWAAFLLLGPIRSEGQEPREQPISLPTVTLQETLDRFVENDYLVQEYRLDWKATDADVEQILNTDGWALDLGGRQEILEGKRLETRNDSLGRSPRRAYDHVTEREHYFLVGLSNSFLEETRKRKADAMQEKIDRLDDVVDFDVAFRTATLNAALAFAGAFYDHQVLDLVKDEMEIEQENLRVTEARFKEEGALTIDVLDAKAEIANLNRKKTELEIKLKRKMNLIRDVWGLPDLEPDLLAAPSIPEETDFVNAHVGELLERAYSQRDDLESRLKAKQSFQESSKYNEIKPDVDFSVSSRYGHFDRDFADEGRHDTDYDIRLDLEVSIPLSMKRRNEARNRRFDLRSKAREYEILANRQTIQEEIEKAFDDFLISHEEIQVQSLLLEQAKEKERMTRVTVETMPEVIKGDPQREYRQVQRDRVQVQEEYLLARKDRLENTLFLLSLLGELTPDYRELVKGGR